MVEYGYDAWGRVTKEIGSMASTLGKLNPFRYRGYVYDEEIGSYYLRSRYYSPVLGRFLNADSILMINSIIGHNGFAYCKNNPYMRVDYDGKLSGNASSFNFVSWLKKTVDRFLALEPVEQSVMHKYPLQAFKVRNHNKTAESTAERFFGDDIGGKDSTFANAFKHAYWNALMARDLGKDVALAFSTAHEDIYVNRMNEQYLGTTIGEHCKMDLANNLQGALIGDSSKGYGKTDKDLAYTVYLEMLNQVYNEAEAGTSFSWLIIDASHPQHVLD